MPQQNPSQARQVDPILSRHARGYRQADHVGSKLFPLAPVAMYGGKVIEFGKEAFKIYGSKRAPGAATKRIQFGYEGKPFSIQPSALEAKVPREIMRDASQVPGIDLSSRAINTVLRSIHLEHEYTCAQIARNAGNYDNDHKVALTSTDRWTSEDSKPVDDVRDAKQAVRESIGVKPNTLIVSATALAALETHPDLVGRAAHTSVKTVTMELLKTVFGVRNIFEGGAVAAGDDNSFGDVWGDDVILAYVPEVPEVQGAAMANHEEPSYGYTYLIDGHPLVEKPYWDENSKSWIYGVSYDNSPVLAGMTAGYLIQNAGAPAA